MGEPLTKDKLSKIQSWEFDNNQTEFRECNHTVVIADIKNVKSAVEWLKEQVHNKGNLDPPDMFLLIDQAFPDLQNETKGRGK